ncbi:hypothetical protein [Photobacterium damselae]|uniref:hypothetical protein n=1 Tax=Photobacterium damselae TaxID=38293 RepID=UPI004067DBD6
MTINIKQAQNCIFHAISNLDTKNQEYLLSDNCANKFKLTSNFSLSKDQTHSKLIFEMGLLSDICNDERTMKVIITTPKIGDPNITISNQLPTNTKRLVLKSNAGIRDSFKKHLAISNAAALINNSIEEFIEDVIRAMTNQLDHPNSTN